MKLIEADVVLSYLTIESQASDLQTAFSGVEGRSAFLGARLPENLKGAGLRMMGCPIRREAILDILLVPDSEARNTS